MRRECSVLVPSSFQIIIAVDRVLERLMLNLNVVTVIQISHVLNPMDSKFQAARFYFCIINQFQASSAFVFNSCDELTKYCYSVELLSSFTKIFECMHILEVSLI